MCPSPSPLTLSVPHRPEPHWPARFPVSHTSQSCHFLHVSPLWPNYCLIWPNCEFPWPPVCTSVQSTCTKSSKNTRSFFCFHPFLSTKMQNNCITWYWSNISYILLHLELYCLILVCLFVILCGISCSIWCFPLASLWPGWTVVVHSVVSGDYRVLQLAIWAQNCRRSGYPRLRLIGQTSICADTRHVQHN